MTLHDHHLLELTISATERTIRLRTAHSEPLGPELGDAVFEGVEAYVFHGDALGTILSDIEPVDAMTLYRAYAPEMARAFADSGGHASWTESEAAAGAFLASGEVRGYRVTSSIGLEGAVWSRSLSIRKR